VTTAAEKSVTRARDKAARARAELEQSIREARAAGLSLREIADLADVSHERVRKIVGPSS